LFGDEQSRWLELLDDDSANFRTALDRAVATGQLDLAERLVDALAWYWFLRGRYVEAMRSLEAVPGSARAGVWRAGFMYLLGHPDAAAERDRWLDDADAMGLWWIAHAASDVGDLSACLSMLDQALKSFEADGNRWGVAAVLAARAKHAHVRADLPALYDDACQSIGIFRSLGDRWGVLQATGWFGAHAELVGDFDEAERLHLEGMEAAEEIGLWPEVASAAGMLGWTAIRRGQFESARAYGERGLRLATEQGQRATQALAELVLGFAARRTGALDEASSRLQALIDAARRQSESVLYLSIVLAELGFVRELQGRLDEALELHLEAFRVSEEFDSLRGQCWALEGIAACHPDKTLAATLLGSSAATRATENYLTAAAETADLERAVAAASEALGADAYQAAYEQGAGLSPAEAFGLLVRQ
jgi:tetratricopeptide (TPR) repeat protein